MYVSFYYLVYFDAKSIEIKRAADRPRKVFGNAEFSRLVVVAFDVEVVLMILIEEIIAPAMLNLGQLKKAMVTPINPRV